MAFGDIISSLVFESQDSELNLSDRDSSDGDSSSDEEESRGIMGSFFGFIGLGRRRNRNIKPILPKKSNNNNVYDYKPGYMRENPHNSSGKNFQVVRIKTLKHNGVEVDKTKEVKMFEIDSNPVLRKPEHSPKEYDLDSSITESEIS